MSQPLPNYPDWVKTDSGFYKNIKTGESTIWHPQVIQIAGPLYAKASNWCKDAAQSANKKRR